MNMKIKHYILLILFITALYFNWVIVHNTTILSDSSMRIQNSKLEYLFPWPGILPDQPFLYKIKVLRNKVISRMFIRGVSRVEFNLLMADKTLYAARLLMDKKRFDLAKETAVKGENYFSVLVSEYAKVVNDVPDELNVHIDRAYTAHQLLIAGFLHDAPDSDKRTFIDVDYFSKTNYELIQKIRQDALLNK